MHHINKCAKIVFRVGSVYGYHGVGPLTPGCHNVKLEAAVMTVIATNEPLLNSFHYFSPDNCCVCKGTL
jgi:hypothetical protein